MVTFVTITATKSPAGLQVRDHGIHGSSRAITFPCHRVDYIALKLAYSTGLVSFVIIWVTERDCILSYSLFTIHTTGIASSFRQ